METNGREAAVQTVMGLIAKPDGIILYCSTATAAAQRSLKTASRTHVEVLAYPDARGDLSSANNII